MSLHFLWKVQVLAELAYEACEREHRAFSKMH
jgi:hypothetical protein